MPLSPRPPRLNKLYLAIASLSFVGFADALYLTVDHYIALPLPCTLTQGCDTVLNSPYAMVGPVPLAVLGTLFYLALLLLAIYAYTTPVLGRFVQPALTGLTAIGLLMSIIFESVQIFIIHAICQYCALSALVSLLLFVCGVILWRAARP